MSLPDDQLPLLLRAAEYLRARNLEVRAAENVTMQQVELTFPPSGSPVRFTWQDDGNGGGVYRVQIP